MKIVYASASRIPSTSANSIQVMKMCQALSQLGHEVVLRVPGAPPPREAKERLWRQYGVSQAFSIQWGTQGRFMAHHRYALSVAALVQRVRPALVFGRHLGGVTAAALAGVDVIFEAHGPIRGRTGLIYWKWLRNSARLARVVVISRALGELFQERMGIKADRLFVAPDGVDLERFASLPTETEARALLGLGSIHRPLVGYAGHLYPGRGIDLILEIALRRPGVDFLVVGGNPHDVDRFRMHAMSMGVSNVTFTGFVANDELPQYLAACEVLLMPYQARVRVSGGGDTSRWMSPMKMFEYMAAGRAILSSDLPVLREVLTSANAMFCPPDDPDAWEAALDLLVSNSTARLALAAQARRDVQAYSWKERARACISIALESGTGNPL